MDPAQDEYSAAFIANSFVRQYYTAMHDNPSQIHRFYDDDSKFSHIDDSELGVLHERELCGRERIQAKINSLGLEGGQAHILFVDSQKCPDEGILILLTGFFSKSRDTARRKFLQTFYLAKKAQYNYYVRNNLFRYLDGEPTQPHTMSAQPQNTEVGAVGDSSAVACAGAQQAAVVVGGEHVQAVGQQHSQRAAAAAAMRQTQHLPLQPQQPQQEALQAGAAQPQRPLQSHQQPQPQPVPPGTAAQTSGPRLSPVPPTDAACCRPAASRPTVDGASEASSAGAGGAVMVTTTDATPLAASPEKDVLPSREAHSGHGVESTRAADAGACIPACCAEMDEATCPSANPAEAAGALDAVPSTSSAPDVPMSWAARVKRQAATAPRAPVGVASLSTETGQKLPQTDTSSPDAEGTDASVASTAAAPAEMQGRTGLFVRGVPEGHREAEKLKAFFRQFGEVRTVAPRENGNASVLFSTAAQMQAALAQAQAEPDGLVYEGVKLNCAELRSPTEHRSGSGGRGGSMSGGRGENRGNPTRGKRVDGSRGGQRGGRGRHNDSNINEGSNGRAPGGASK